MSDEQIIEKIKKGEKQLYELIVRKYNQRLYRAARAIMKNELDIEDVLQDTYLKAYLALSQFENRSHFSTWITRILINNANERLRKKGRETIVDASEGYHLFEKSDDHEVPDFTVTNNELKKILETSVDNLPENLRVVYVLREVEGLSVSETAECLELSEENVKTRLHRAKAILKDDLYRRTRGDIEIFRFGAERCDQMIIDVMSQLNLSN